MRVISGSTKIGLSSCTWASAEHDALSFLYIFHHWVQCVWHLLEIRCIIQRGSEAAQTQIKRCNFISRHTFFRINEPWTSQQFQIQCCIERCPIYFIVVYSHSHFHVRICYAPVLWPWDEWGLTCMEVRQTTTHIHTATQKSCCVCLVNIIIISSTQHDIAAHDWCQTEKIIDVSLSIVVRYNIRVCVCYLFDLTR